MVSTDHFWSNRWAFGGALPGPELGRRAAVPGALLGTSGPGWALSLDRSWANHGAGAGPSVTNHGARFGSAPGALLGSSCPRACPAGPLRAALGHGLGFTGAGLRVVLGQSPAFCRSPQGSIAGPKTGPFLQPSGPPQPRCPLAQLRATLGTSPQSPRIAPGPITGPWLELGNGQTNQRAESGPT